MPMVARTLLSLLFWGFMLVSSALLFPVAALLRLVTAPFDRRLAILHQFTCFWASLYTWVNPLWRVRIDRRDRLTAEQPCIYVANHQSFVDILALFRLFRHFTWVSKRENFRVPLIGWNMSLNRYIAIDRTSRAGGLQMLRAADEALGRGSSLMIFPEGTRSADGRLGSFKDGAFELAVRHRVPVQPLAIRGSGRALPKKGFVLRGRHAITITALDPVPRAEVAGLGAAALRDRVRATIAAALEEDTRP